MTLQPTTAKELPGQLAQLVACSRERFQDVYDHEMQRQPLTGGLLREVFATVVLGPDYMPLAEDTAAFKSAFERAQQEAWLPALVSRCLQLRMIHPLAWQLMLALGQHVVAPEGSEDALLSPEAVVDTQKSLRDPGRDTGGLLSTMPKICLVHAELSDGSRTQGTGFLIGPQAVLTAWHVIAPLIDPVTGKAEFGSHERLRIDFDRVEPLSTRESQPMRSYEVQEDWLGENSSGHGSERPCPCVSHGSDQTAVHAIQAEGINGDHINRQWLDFAVIRLKGSPGRERGVVTLPREAVRLRNGQPLELMLFQHPKQYPMRYSHGHVTGFFGDGEPKPRLRHHANTAVGSSGGLCVNSRFESIGLHQAAVVDRRGALVANQAIPTALIAERLNTALGIIDPTLDPLWRLSTHQPLIGRENFQSAVWTTVRGAKRIIAVRGQRGMGLAFSKKILTSILAPHDAVIIGLTADKIGQEPLALATELLKRCGCALPAGTAFPNLHAAGNPEAWLRDNLVPALVDRLHSIALGKQVWIVLEDLDQHDIPEGGARRLLMNLMLATTDAPALRFLLLGPRLYMPEIPADLIEEDNLAWPSTHEVETYIRRYCTFNRVNDMHAAERERLAAAAILDVTTADQPSDEWKLTNQWKAAVKYVTAYLPRPKRKS